MTQTADVIVVGAGPAGSTAAYYLAHAGLDVLLLEKGTFPREKVCGDGLTPRAVREISLLGLPTPEAAGWRKNRGLRLVASGKSVEIRWPELSDYPSYGLTRTREGFDQDLVDHAVAVGARLQTSTSVTGPVTNKTGRVVGVKARTVDDKGRKIGEEQEYTAPVVVAADGNSSRLALGAGRKRREDRPLGVAVRTYYQNTRQHDEFIESWLELWDGEPGKSSILPGYGWIFPLADGSSNVGLGMLNSSKSFGAVDNREILKKWVAALPTDQGFDESNQRGVIRGAALPMGFNRTPHYDAGLLLIGDSAGLVSPFNGEGIAYAMESARWAAEVIVDALRDPAVPYPDVQLYRYPRIVSDELGSHFTIGRVFAQLIGNPTVMKYAVRTGMSVPALMRFVVRLMANLSDSSGVEPSDLAIRILEGAVPATSNN